MSKFKVGDKVKCLIPAVDTDVTTGLVIGFDNRYDTEDYVHVKMDNFDYKLHGTEFHGFYSHRVKLLNSHIIRERLGIK